ncbi:MAG: sirohydrochlorin chelatase [Rhodopirellula sp. JB044]|uniref:sirohydrochlorin chelatase n=1 Tax=Rhodopirellula sp. JB044 TaxID=3342844 RepID=UPI00370C34B1
MPDRPTMDATSRRGVLLVGHGTRDEQGTDEFFQLGERLAQRMRGTAVVKPCLLEFQQPDIAAAWDSLMSAGCDRVTVAPLLLFSAGHAKSDIPGEVETARSKTPNGDNVEVRFAKPITRNAAMIEAVRSRLRKTLCRRPALASSAPSQSSDVLGQPQPRTAVVMVGRGSRDPCATSDMRLLSEVAVRGTGRKNSPSLAAEFGLPSTGLWTTFYAMASPRLPETLEQVAGTGDFDRVIVQPHLLFAGRLYEAIQKQVGEAAERFPGMQFDVSEYLGPTDLVASALADRIAAAEA